MFGKNTFLYGSVAAISGYAIANALAGDTSTAESLIDNPTVNQTALINYLEGAKSLKQTYTTGLGIVGAIFGAATDKFRS